MARHSLAACLPADGGPSTGRRHLAGGHPALRPAYPTTPSNTGTVQFGLALPQYDYSVPGRDHVDWHTLVATAQRAEQLGFDSLWLADHLSMSIEKYGGPAGEHRGFDSITTLGALAGATTKTKLGTLVICSQLRPAAVLAKQLAAVDVISHGRLIAGFGAGWNEAEYEEAGIPFHRPGRRIDELAATVDEVRRVWDPGDDSTPCRPPPVQKPRPPIWVGGKGDRLLDLAARRADGWNTVWAWTFDDYRERARTLDRACRRHGRDPATVTRSVGLYTLVGEGEADLRRRFDELRRLTPAGVLDGLTLEDWRSGHLVGTVEEVRDQVGMWAELGVTHLIIGLGAVPFAGTTTDDLELVASALSLGAP